MLDNDLDLDLYKLYTLTKMRDKLPGDQLEPYKLGDDCMVQDCGCIIEINHKTAKGLYVSKIFDCIEHSKQ